MTKERRDAAVNDTFAAFHRVAETAPELALLGAVIFRAVADATAGDREAREWLAGRQCQGCLAALTRDDRADLDVMQSRLLARLPATYQTRLSLDSTAG